MAYANITGQDTGTYEFRSFHFADAGDRNDDDFRPITPTGGSSRIISPIGPTVPASVRGVTAVRTWGYMSTDFCPSLKPKAVLQLQMPSHVLGRLCHMETRRKPP